MAKQSLNERERAVLGYFSLAATAPITTAARALRLQTHVVHYTLKRLRERQIVRGVAPYIDLYRHGAVVAAVLFNLEIAPGTQHNRAIDRIKSVPRVSWLARVGGRFQLAASIRCFSLHELIATVAEIRQVTAGGLRDETMVLRTGAVLFGRRYLSTDSGPTRRNSALLGYGVFAGEGRATQSAANPATLDRTDLELLRALANQPEMDLAVVAKKLGVSSSTVQRRMRELENSGTIRGYVLQLSAAALGVRSYRISLQVAGTVEGGTRQKILEFCVSNPQVVQLEECIGEWQYELEIEAVDAHGIDQFRSELLSTFGPLIRRIELIELFEHLYYRGVPEGLQLPG